MNTRATCKVCGKHLFDYEGYLGAGVIVKSAKVTYPDGTRAAPREKIPFCSEHGDLLNVCRGIRLEQISNPNPEPQQLSLPLPGSSS